MTLSDTFLSGIVDPTLWDAVTGSAVTTFFAGNELSLFFSGQGSRSATTKPINTTLYKSLSFDLIYGDGQGVGQNGGSNVSNTLVGLYFKNASNPNWTLLQQYSKPGQWTTFNINLTGAASAPGTQFLWEQTFTNESTANLEAGTQVWALDNISFSAEEFRHPTSVDFSNDLRYGLFSDISNGKVTDQSFARPSKSLYFANGGVRFVQTVPVDTTKTKSLSFDLIYGDGQGVGQNGGSNVSNTLVGLYFKNASNPNWTLLQQYSKPGQWTTFNINLTGAASAPGTQFLWEQTFTNESTANLEAGTQVWALDNISFSAEEFRHPTSVDFSNDLRYGLFSDISNGKVTDQSFARPSKSLYFANGGVRFVQTVPVDTTKTKSLSFDMIYGDGQGVGQNGGSNVSNTLVGLYFKNASNPNWTLLQQYSKPGQWTTFNINLTGAASAPGTQFLWEQTYTNESTANLEAGTQVWALDNISFSAEEFRHPTSVDFSNNLRDGLFGDISNGKIISTLPGRSKALYFAGSGGRFVEIQAIDTRKYQKIEFDLIYGNGSSGSINSSPVELSYWSNESQRWVSLQVIANPSSWSRQVIELPPVARTEATKLRLAQASQGAGVNVWAIDNIRLINDATPPRISEMAVRGSQITLTFSEPIAASDLPLDRFTATVGTSARTITGIQPGASQSQLLLTLSGAQPRSAETVRLLYADPTGDDFSGVIEDEFGNDMASIRTPGLAADTFRSSSSVPELASTYSRLILEGQANVSGIGNSSVNVITGNPGRNVLGGLGGNDVLTGGGGADLFRFSTPLNARLNKDQLTDFSPLQGDRIQLARAVFASLTRPGTLDPRAFAIGGATTADHHILYNRTAGTLSYDRNGKAPGGAVVFASLPTGLDLTHDQFIVI